MVATVVVLFMFGPSRCDRARSKTIRDDEIAAGASGLNNPFTSNCRLRDLRVLAAGIAGGIFAHYISSLNYTMAGWLNSINCVITGRVFGGRVRSPASIVSAIGLTILPGCCAADFTVCSPTRCVAGARPDLPPAGIFQIQEFSPASGQPHYAVPRPPAEARNPWPAPSSMTSPTTRSLKEAHDERRNPAPPSSKPNILRHHLRWSESRISFNMTINKSSVADRPQRRRQDHGVQPADRRTKPTEGRVRLDGTRMNRQRRPIRSCVPIIARTFQNIRLFKAAHRRGENVLVAF